MAAMEDFVAGDDLDAIFNVIEEDLLFENHEFITEMDDMVGEIAEVQPASGFTCDRCPKICKTKRGLTRHANAKHRNTETYSSSFFSSSSSTTTAAKSITAEALLHPLYFKQYVQKSATKLASDECYSEKTRKEFINYQVTLDDANFTYQYVRDVIKKFKGNAEKFYPSFYKCVSSDDIVFKNLSRRSSVILGFEVANHVLAHLTDSAAKENTVDFSSQISFSDKERNIIQYLCGYVFGTFYRRIRRSKSCQSIFGIQCLDLLLAGKSSENLSDDKSVLVHAKDRGGLWIVTPEVYEIFSLVEQHFRKSTFTISKNIDSKKMVSELLKNASVLCNYNKLRNKTNEKVSKEVALNMLEHLIMLYIRVRIFSLVKDKCETHKIVSKKKKARSLRTEIKKSSSSLDQGH